MHKNIGFLTFPFEIGQTGTERHEPISRGTSATRNDEQARRLAAAAQAGLIQAGYSVESPRW